jgi:hypothetical protein
MNDLSIKVKSKIDEYLEFDSDILFEKCDFLEIFGGSIRDSIAGMKIHDVDILALSKSAKICAEILESKGYHFIELLNGKELQEMYKDIHCIFEPWTFLKQTSPDDDLKMVQIIRPSIDVKNDKDKIKLTNPDNSFNFLNESGFFRLMKEVDLSCCGVSYNGKIIKENCQDAIKHCQWGYYLINKEARMYNESRILMRTSKLDGRGWTNIENLSNEQKINFDRNQKLEYILNDN